MGLRIVCIRLAIPEVANLQDRDVIFDPNERVFQLDVAMADTGIMQVREARNQLLEVKPRQVLSEIPSFLNPLK